MHSETYVMVGTEYAVGGETNHISNGLVMLEE
jgi:hypothetical protein